ncbi:hypothetical protein P43SY_007929 [Pythium insidiosum]|uniref:Endonuclease/exonuclease/phosphatase domain-containing protein n=1 Tax=Pythium insidiosum TaxID=114742 RepID=A0AAD5M6R7_PYTIN|nr:hypothetical protein P43SY_007929 [Pythium insidiosum]
MIARLIVTLLAFAAVSSHVSAQLGAPPSVKVMSFNLRTTLAKDPCPAGCWEQRKWRAKQLLERYQPDLIGTQEGAPDQIAFFQDELGFNGFGECAGACDGNERDSIFYRADRWQFIEGTTFALSDTPDVLPSNTWNLEYLRAAVIARLRLRSTGAVVCMLNTHFDISRGHAQSAQLVAKRMAAFCKSNDSAIMTGDLNTPPATPAVQYLTNSGALQGQRTPMPLFETLTTSGAGGPTWIGPTFSDKVTGSKIDYILARRDPHTCVTAGHVLTDKFGGFSCSDHAVVMTDFCLGAQCRNCR